MDKNEEFKKADEKFDKINEANKNMVAAIKSKVELKQKIFMKISDVDLDDAKWFKEFCDKTAGGKQFLAIKHLRVLAERLDPIMVNVFSQINSMNERISHIESLVEVEEPIEEPIEEDEEEGPKVPITQGSNKK